MRCEVVERDRHGRLVAKVFSPNGVDIGRRLEPAGELVKTGARIVRPGRYVVFQLAEVAVPRILFAEILRRIDRLGPRPPPLPA